MVASFGHYVLFIHIEFAVSHFFRCSEKLPTSSLSKEIYAANDEDDGRILVNDETAWFTDIHLYNFTCHLTYLIAYS